LGFDWLLLFMQPQVKSSSVILSANCLLILLSNPQSLARFREGVSTGAGWARSRDLITSQGFANNAAAGPLRLVGRTFSVASEDVPTSPSTNLQSQQLPGFQLLGWMLVNHTNLPEIYYLIIGLMVGKPQLRTSSQVKIRFIIMFYYEISCFYLNLTVGSGNHMELFVWSQSRPTDRFPGWTRSSHVLPRSHHRFIDNDAGHNESGGQQHR
jgi:hypothetical protein